MHLSMYPPVHVLPVRRGERHSEESVGGAYAAAQCFTDGYNIVRVIIVGCVSFHVLGRVGRVRDTTDNREMRASIAYL